jgi:hypothetical protein
MGTGAPESLFLDGHRRQYAQALNECLARGLRPTPLRVEGIGKARGANLVPISESLVVGYHDAGRSVRKLEKLARMRRIREAAVRAIEAIDLNREGEAFLALETATRPT